MSFFGSNKILGVDIGTSSIKVVEMSKSSGRYKLENYGIIEVGRSGEAMNEAIQTAGAKQPRLSEDEAAGGIIEILRRTGITTRDAVLSIPSYLTFSTVINMPYVSEEELANAVSFEARKYVPVPVSEVMLDWSIINVVGESRQIVPDAETEKKKPANVEVFLVAVPKSEIEKYQRIMKKAGLNMKVLETESFALIRSLVGNDLSPVAIVNIGSKGTAIMLVDNGVERINQNIDFGGFEITKNIALAMKASFAKADDIKKTNGLLPDNPAVAGVISASVDKIITETLRIAQNYENSRGVKMSKVIVIGGILSMPGFLEYFRSGVGGTVDIGNALARVVIAPELETLRNDLSSTLAVAVGLAMRGV
ncbi:MAG: type IV pilus assembly protein PilM [Parcubacteria group bacterium Licking1014_17]|nr:MAG: type IV pilus assembly protein PilM [Parcubacteria group bacterium Licking1014_17]